MDVAHDTGVRERKKCIRDFRIAKPYDIHLGPTILDIQLLRMFSQRSRALAYSLLIVAFLVAYDSTTCISDLPDYYNEK